ncbi:MAG: hypothetical protein P8I94_04635, partial [Emcibacteraceae bacterium]|nr:hypothetical protein [Emcibacteraceae bacterium]
YILYYGKRPFVSVLLLLSLSAIVIFATEIEQISNAVDRLNSIGSSNDDNAAGRGYHRIWEESHYLLIGSGEGGLYRFYQGFKSVMAFHELHSTLGMLFFSYGPLGLFIFIAIFIKLFISKGWYAVLPFLPLFAYGLTHQGFRFSFFWMLLSIVSTSYNKSVFSEPENQRKIKKEIKVDR